MLGKYLRQRTSPDILRTSLDILKFLTEFPIAEGQWQQLYTIVLSKHLVVVFELRTFCCVLLIKYGLAE
jgi:hypothetical protein